MSPDLRQTGSGSLARLAPDVDGWSSADATGSKV
jgi:hypothetical protein